MVDFVSFVGVSFDFFVCFVGVSFMVDFVGVSLMVDFVSFKGVAGVSVMPFLASFLWVAFMGVDIVIVFAFFTTRNTLSSIATVGFNFETLTTQLSGGTAIGSRDVS
jgi:hypothetical protein